MSNIKHLENINSSTLRRKRNNLDELVHIVINHAFVGKLQPWYRFTGQGVE